MLYAHAIAGMALVDSNPAVDQSNSHLDHTLIRLVISVAVVS